MKSVAGTKWVNQHIQRLKSLGRWMKAVPERESFRFGDGHEVWSEFSFIFEATLLGVRVVLRLSVVPGDCPPLLSKPACTQLGIVIDTENHTVSSRKLRVRRYGMSQTFGGHYALPIAEFEDHMSPIEDPDLPVHSEAIPVYVASPLDIEPESPPEELPWRTWIRRDRQMECTVGPGRNGPPWHCVFRRVVYVAGTNEMLLNEPVTPQTRIRTPLPRRCDTRTILFFRLPGSAGNQGDNSMIAMVRGKRENVMTTPRGEIPAHHRLDVEDSDQDYEKALLEDWSRVDTPGESRSPSRPPSKPKLRPAARKASLGARLKAGLTRTVRSKSADKTRERSAEKSPSPRAHRHRSPEAYSAATDHKEKDKQTGALLKGQAAGPKEKDKRTLASLKEQAAELEEILLHYLDPSSLPTEGSKATKAYWVSRIQMLEEELELCQGPQAMEDEAVELAKPSLSGEDASVPSLDSPPPRTRGRASSTTSSTTPTATARAKPKGAPKKQHALTDHSAPFPTMSSKFSDDLPINIMISLQSQLFTFKWKTLVWMLRVRAAVRAEMGHRVQWKRNPRWLMLLLGKQMGSLWGHIGAARQLCHDPRLSGLMKGNPLETSSARAAVADRRED
ncbi:unnamed protein product [Symbiodinium natans]|uniref:Uncharacterized protein n=1 Tax=Symbiodinium natans TaxID=878477 RepID=A0A812TCF6_9DINO|nr:unnamed protein product [Symbiodinium natans]